MGMIGKILAALEKKQDEIMRAQAEQADRIAAEQARTARNKAEYKRVVAEIRDILG